MGELGFNSWVCENHFISYSCIFFILQCFEERLLQILLIFKNSFFFYNFDRSSLFFDQSKLRLKISISLCLVRLIEPVFRSIEHRESSFFLNTVFNSFKTLFQNFFKLSSLSPTWQGSIKDFLSFSTKFLARFFSPKAGKTFIPLLLLLFS